MCYDLKSPYIASVIKVVVEIVRLHRNGVPKSLPWPLPFNASAHVPQVAVHLNMTILWINNNKAPVNEHLKARLSMPSTPAMSRLPLSVHQNDEMP